jgi:hypothetical protein
MVSNDKPFSMVLANGTEEFFDTGEQLATWYEKKKGPIKEVVVKRVRSSKSNDVAEESKS